MIRYTSSFFFWRCATSSKLLFDLHLESFRNLHDAEKSQFAEVEFDFDHRGLLMDGGSWTFAFGLKNGSTVHYRGDAPRSGTMIPWEIYSDNSQAPQGLFVVVVVVVVVSIHGGCIRHWIIMMIGIRTSQL